MKLKWENPKLIQLDLSRKLFVLWRIGDWYMPRKVANKAVKIVRGLRNESITKEHEKKL